MSKNYATRREYGVMAIEHDNNCIGHLAKRLAETGIPFRRKRLDEHCSRLIIDAGITEAQRETARQIFNEAK